MRHVMAYVENNPVCAHINTISNYDGMGQITGSSQSVDNGTTNRTFSYAYNLAGALKSKTYPSGRVVTTGYDAANRPISLVSGSTTYLSGLSYAAHGALTAYLYANGLNRSQTFNSRLRPTDMKDWVTSGGSSNPLLELGYMYGGGSDALNNGNPTQIAITTAQTPGGTASSFTQSYAYDAFNRLCAAAEGVTVSNCSSSITGNTWAQQFSYDQFGNMQGTSTGSGIPALPSGTYNAQNQLTGSYSCTASSPPFDCSGNQLTRGSSALSYDAENRQTVDHDTVSGNYTYYTYDGMGERVAKSTSGGVSTVYVHDAFGNVAAEYSTGGAAPMPCTTCYLSWDHLGSTRMVTDGSANVVPYGRHDYLPFASEVPAGLGGRTLGLWPGTGSQTDYLTAKYTGAERDSETGFDFLQALYHANVQGRFMSVDPGSAGASLGAPQSWNGYSYVGNNPMRFVDPSGLSTCDSADCDDPTQPGTSAWICDNFPSYCDVWSGNDSPGAGNSAPNPGTLPPWLGASSPPGVVNGLQPSGASNQPASNQPSPTQQQIAQLAELLRYLLSKPWVLSWIEPWGPLPGAFGIGPAGSFAWNPETHNLCAAVGLGGSVGHNVSLGPLLVGQTQEGKRASPRDIDAILQGWSISFGGNLPSPSGPGPGVQVTANGSGTAGGLTVGSPGASISITWAACGKLWR